MEVRGIIFRVVSARALLYCIYLLYLHLSRNDLKSARETYFCAINNSIELNSSLNDAIFHTCEAEKRARSQDLIHYHHFQCLH